MVQLWNNKKDITMKLFNYCYSRITTEPQQMHTFLFERMNDFAWGNLVLLAFGSKKLVCVAGLADFKNSYSYTDYSELWGIMW